MNNTNNTNNIKFLTLDLAVISFVMTAIVSMLDANNLYWGLCVIFSCILGMTRVLISKDKINVKSENPIPYYILAAFFYILALYNGYNFFVNSIGTVLIMTMWILAGTGMLNLGNFFKINKGLLFNRNNNNIKE